jgi:hypothetical protein
MLPGNVLARTHALYAATSSDIAQAGADLFEQSLKDAGGREELIAREVTQHEYRAALDVNIRKVARALEQHGLFDRRGRLRVGWLSKLESLVAAALCIDRVLGLKRVPKDVDPFDAIRRAVNEANK